MTTSKQKPTADDLRIAVGQYNDKPENLDGSSLEEVLDDNHLDNATVLRCRRLAVLNKDPDGVKLADMLLLFSEEVRKEALQPEWLQEMNFDKEEGYDYSVQRA